MATVDGRSDTIRIHDTIKRTKSARDKRVPTLWVPVDDLLVLIREYERLNVENAHLRNLLTVHEHEMARECNPLPGWVAHTLEDAGIECNTNASYDEDAEYYHGLKAD